ncbi:hypothetical protein CXG81DRAFT_18853 [Caulochytrium protostelioides]|uniref:sn-1-specific diacylglycerol lipase n=1 Tax=Caulochytrium protostelioides TaxID=1555241 RepID=A0A4P9X7V7_9FUNG|nr:hypothetical protein CXG81DRAFT_18853 [Caulochytrium protostelioides]|eukprot:RKP01325.1 hypothetical protein CXG81DRAFT_18853 [Caulochytrium protostelioides]
MARLAILGRLVAFADDDVWLLAIYGILCHAIWLSIALTVFFISTRGCTLHEAMHTYLVVQIVVTSSLLVTEVIIMRLSAAGTIAETGARRWLPSAVHVHFGVLMGELALQIAGLCYLFHPQIRPKLVSNCATDTTAKAAVGLTHTMVVWSLMTIAMWDVFVILLIVFSRSPVADATTETAKQGFQQAWQRRLAWITGKLNGEGQNALRTVSRDLADYFQDVDWASSDVFIGLILLKREQKELKEAMEIRRLLADRELRQLAAGSERSSSGSTEYASALTSRDPASRDSVDTIVMPRLSSRSTVSNAQRYGARGDSQRSSRGPPPPRHGGSMNHGGRPAEGIAGPRDSTWSFSNRDTLRAHDPITGLAYPNAHVNAERTPRMLPVDPSVRSSSLFDAGPHDAMMPFGDRAGPPGMRRSRPPEPLRAPDMAIVSHGLRNARAHGRTSMYTAPWDASGRRSLARSPMPSSRQVADALAASNPLRLSVATDASDPSAQVEKGVCKEDIIDVLHFAHYAEIAYYTNLQEAGSVSHVDASAGPDPDPESASTATAGAPRSRRRRAKKEAKDAIKYLRRGAELLYHSLQNEVYQSPYLVVVDHHWKAIVLAVRGTYSAADILVDLNIQLEVLQVPRSMLVSHRITHTQDELHWAHSGFLQTARNIAAELEREGTLNALCRGGKLEGYRLVLCGHSLGAGVATLLTFLLRQKQAFASATCYAYSPPGCVMSASIAPLFEKFVTSVVNGDDLVPRLSRNSMEILKRDVGDRLATCHIAKWRLMASVLTNKLFSRRLERLKWVRQPLRPASVAMIRGGDRGALSHSRRSRGAMRGFGQAIPHRAWATDDDSRSLISDSTYAGSEQYVAGGAYDHGQDDDDGDGDDASDEEDERVVTDMARASICLDTAADVQRRPKRRLATEDMLRLKRATADLPARWKAGVGAYTMAHFAGGSDEERGSRAAQVDLAIHENLSTATPPMSVPGRILYIEKLRDFGGEWNDRWLDQVEAAMAAADRAAAHPPAAAGDAVTPEAAAAAARAAKLMQRSAKYLYVPRWAAAAEFQEIVVSRSMIKNHAPFDVLRQFDEFARHKALVAPSDI